jgi:hypothetical protein
VASGVAGKWFGHAAVEQYAVWFLGIGFAMLFYAAIKSTYYRSRTPWVDVANKDPQPLRLTWLDYLKAGVCWLDAFKRTYAFKPGLYYTGEHYDSKAPLLVTANYFLTVFLVARRIRAFDD